MNQSTTDAAASHPRRRARRAILAGLAALAAPLAAAATFAAWFNLRPPPEGLEVSLGAGATYSRTVSVEPLAVVHEVRVELGTPGLEFLVTPSDRSGGRALRAATTSAFARRYDLDVAINGDFFDPWHSNGPLDYYPHEGDPVDVQGLAISNGLRYGEPGQDSRALFVSCAGAVGFEAPEETCQAISGWPLLTGGLINTRDHDARHPRSALCLDAARRWLGIFVVDGRQARYSQGMTLAELGRHLAARGCWDAINLDGGGSSVLVLRMDGEIKAVSSPIHTRLPGRERPVANHLGLRLPRGQTRAGEGLESEAISDTFPAQTRSGASR